jgi:Na+/H+ antiporter NhaD/arsenite permease-like protein
VIGDLVFSKRDWLWYALCVLVTPLLLERLGLSTQQTLAVGGFCIVLFGAIFFWKYRLAFSCLGIAFLLAAGLLDVPHLVEFAGLDIILFLVAMMTVIGFLEERHFFEFVIDRLLLVVGPHPRRIMVVMMVMAAISAALVDEVTSILFMVAAVLNLLGRAKINPIPYIMMLVFTTNIGSSATVVGNPVGVIIALRSGLTFLDFLRWATPISLVCLAVTIPICLRLFDKDIKALKPVLAGKKGERQLEHMVEEEHVTKRGIRLSGWLFAGVIAGLVCHHPLEHWLGLPKNTMLLGVALIGAGIALAISGEKARQLVEKRVDWWTLSFFLMLFASVGTLKQTGVTGVLAERVIGLSGGSVPVLTTLFAWSSGILTAVMDNVLAVATFVPIVSDVAGSGIDTFPLWWAMLMGGTLMGNATLIGSTANIVAVGLLERRELGEITFAQWLRPGLVVAIPTLLLANLLILAQLSVMPHAVAAPLGH